MENCESKGKFNCKLNSSMIKASNSFTAAKGSMPLSYKINAPISAKHKADDQNELHAIKKLKTFHISSIDVIKRKNENGSDRPNKKQKLLNFDEDDSPPGTQWDGNNYSCAYDALFTILFKIWATKPKKWKKNIPRVQSISFYTA